jgi:hypothetical protein
MNSYNSKYIERHGITKPIGTIELTYSSIYSDHEHKTKGVFISTSCTIEDTNG